MYLSSGDCFTLGCRASVLEELAMRRGILYGANTRLDHKSTPLGRSPHSELDECM